MTADVLETLGRLTVLICAPAGPALASEAEAGDLVGAASWRGIDWIVMPASRLSDDFFRLSSGLAGAITQKFATYRLGLAVTGDISAHTEASTSLRDFVRESNRGRQVWFMEDVDSVRTRLTR